jgi:c-di-GMP-binding flagellar brake protein YcgR
MQIASREPRAFEMRKTSRIPFRMSVSFTPRLKNNTHGLITDLSEGGAYLISTEKLAEQSKVLLYLRFQREGRERLCIVSAKVVRADSRTGLALQGYGLAFRTISTASQKILKDVVENTAAYAS